MNRLKAFSLLILCALGFLAQAQRSNCGVNPQPNTIVQKDGSLLTLYPYGNEAVNYLETESGYTLLLNKQTGIYEFAVINNVGNLDLSGLVASDKADKNIQKTSPITPHLRYNKAQESMLMQYFNEQTRITEDLGKAGANVFPPFGDRKVLVLMVQYPDLLATIPVSNFEMLMNQPGNASTGSYRDYYMNATKNRLRLTGDVYGWFMADSGHKYYGKTSSPSYSSACTKLLTGAIKSADSLVDYAKYDSDTDGYVDAVILIHAGQGAEESSAPNSGNYIWSFRSSYNSATLYDGKRFRSYCMFPEKLYNGGNMTIVGIGVIAHEFGHILDLPDLYSTVYNNSGAGNYTIMAAGTWLNNQKTPAIFDAWSRNVMGWNTTQLITNVGNYTIPYSVSDSNFAFRINTKKASEYFLLENRQNKGFDKFLPSKGLAVWHINTGYAGKLSQLPNNTNNDTSALGVQLLQADGLRELERNVNSGNLGDLFPGSTVKRNITPFTNPSTNLQTNYDPTNIYITNITLNTDSSITFRFSSQPSAAFTSDRVSGCAPLTVSLTNSSMSAASFKWTFGDGTTNTTTLSPVIKFEQPGTYTVMLTVYDSIGTPSDSITTSIQVYPSPVASYTYTQTGNKLNLSNTSSGSSSVQWLYNIGATSYSSSTDQLNNVTVPDTGLFKYMLIAFNNYGCADTAYGTTNAFRTAVNDAVNVLNNVNVYPNPFTNEFRMSLQLKNNTSIGFEILNVIGEKIATLPSHNYGAGTQTFAFHELVNSKPGMYFLKVITDNETKTIRLTKTE